MATSHRMFMEPEGGSCLWRYMDFTKYVALLESKSLYFSRADCLGDPFEGSVSQSTVKRRREAFKYASALSKGTHTENTHLGIYSSFFGRLPKLTFINCWHMNDAESAAMWRLYAQSGMGVALRSSFQSLFNALPKEIFVGMVQYRDYATTEIPDGNTYAPFVFKRKSFSHENEVRAVFQDDPQAAGDLNTRPVGKHVPIDLHHFVEEVRVSPGAPTWYVVLVKDVTNRYSFKVPVIQSEIDSTALF